MKFAHRVLFALLLLSSPPVIRAQTLLTVPPSTRAWGMGGAGAAVLDPTIGFFNPGGLGVYALDNRFVVVRNDPDWLSGVDLDIDYSNTFVIAGLPAHRLLGLEDPQLSLAIGFHRQEFELRGIAITDEFGNLISEYRSYDRNNAFTISAGVRKGMELGIGFAVKSVVTEFGDQHAGALPYIERGTATARDFGLFVRVPIFEALAEWARGDVRHRIGPFSPKVDIAVAHAWLNRGGDLDYGYSWQSPPLPSADLFGRSVQVGLEYEGAPVIRWLATRDDWTSRHDPDDERVTRREGWEVELLGVVGLSKGDVPGDRYTDLRTRGAFFHTGGLAKWAPVLARHGTDHSVPWYFTDVEFYVRVASILKGPNTILGGTEFREFGVLANLSHWLGH